MALKCCEKRAPLANRVLMLTARGEVRDRVTGLQLGADDYLAKPFAMQELMARVRALGRRYAEEPEIALHISDLTLDLANPEVRRGERLIELSTRELTLLKVLMREPGRVFTRTELCERVWEREHEYDMKLVEVFIGRQNLVENGIKYDGSSGRIGIAAGHRRHGGSYRKK